MDVLLFLSTKSFMGVTAKEIFSISDFSSVNICVTICGFFVQGVMETKRRYHGDYGYEL
jgi:hypothetical protein